MSSYGNRQKHESKNPLQRALIARFHRELAHTVLQLKPREILDVGCGEGYVLQALREHGVDCPMMGIDFSRDAIDIARKRVPNAHFEVDDALVVADSGRRFDLVLMTEVLEHIPNPERMLPVLERIAQRFVITSVPWEPFFCGLNLLRGKHVRAFGNDPEHVNHWGRAEFIELMQRRFALHSAPLVFPWTLVASRRLDTSTNTDTPRVNV